MPSKREWVQHFNAIINVPGVKALCDDNTPDDIIGVDFQGHRAWVFFTSDDPGTVAYAIENTFFAIENYGLNGPEK